MLKKVITVVVSIVIIATVAAFYYGYSYLNPDADFIIEYMKDHPESASITLFENDQATLLYNSEELFPLASTKKIIIGAAFSRAVTRGIIDTNEMVPLDELKHFYFPETDGGAHEGWLNEMYDKYGGNISEVSMMDVAKGMMKYSSNANASYLTGLIGPSTINRILKLQNIKPHSPIYHSQAAAFNINLVDSTVESRLSFLIDMNDTQYKDLSRQMYEKLKNTPHEKKDQIIIPSFTDQQVWSDRLERSTTLVYARLMNDIMHDRFMGRNERMILKDLLDWPMDFPKNQEKFIQLAAKGGSTLYLLTEAIYAETNNTDKLAFAIFFKNLGSLSSPRVMKALPLFEEKLLNSEVFRNKVVTQLN